MNKIYYLLLYLLKKGSKQDDFFVIMDEFFTPKEKILFSKRITIIYLLSKGVNQKNICEILNISKETASKYNLFLANKKLKLVKVLKAKAIREEIFWKIDEILAEFVIQPGIKLGHWQLYWNQKQKEHQRKEYGIDKS